MAEGFTIRTEGLRELIARGDAAQDKTKRKLVREGLRQAVEPARLEAQRLFIPTSYRTATNFRTVVRKTGTIYIEQRLKRTTGKRPDFGRLQYRDALLPGFSHTYGIIVANLQTQVDEIGTQFVTD